MNDIIKKINECKTMPELDSLRLEVVSEMKKGKDHFNKVQTAFRKKKNKLKRIPLADRDW